MEYRAENKYLVSEGDLTILESRLQAVMQKDVHQSGNGYAVRSLYFDSLADQCMDENDSGVDDRKKYRIRLYDSSTDLIHLEIKEKLNGFTRKDSCVLSLDEAEQICAGSLPLRFDARKPLNLLQVQMRMSHMRQKAVISYDRSAFVYPEGNVRVTFDRNITASRNCRTFFSRSVTGNIPVLPSGMHVLEVKYDEFLPDFIASRLELGSLQQTSFSKYYLGRLAINGSFPIDC